MIIKTRRKNESIFKRLFRNTVNRHSGMSVAHVLPQEMFEAELVKEAFRSNRRRTDREFALVTFDFSDQQATDRKLASLIAGFRSRLRISDVVGWFDLRLAVLLPETKKAGALLVANQLAVMSLEKGIKVDTHVAIYPWDDTLVAVTEELKSDSTFTDDRSFDDQNDDRDRNAPNGKAFDDHCTNDHSQNDSYHRVDNAHEANNQDRYGSNNAFESVTFSSVAVDVQQVKTTFVADSYTKLSVNKAVQGTGNSIQVLQDRTPKWKRAIDIAGAGAGLLMLTPVFACAAAAIKCSSRGPVFFVQRREGKDGREFGILKFRTMNINAEAEQDALRTQSEQDGPAFKLKNDPRVTFVGRYLRKSCIDELPQLYNVLIGEMSLVGPRPLPVRESQQCTSWQRQRLSVLPGLTCIWQAHGGRDIKFSEWMRMDMEYIRKRSLFYDLRLICETAFLALLHRGSV